MAIVLALISALTYGVSDFLGGFISRNVSAWQTAVVGQSSSTVCAFIAGLIVTGSPTGNDWLCASIAGIGSGFGTTALYRGLSRGKMSVVAPISAIGSALVPITFGLATGDRPSPLIIFGIICAFPAIYLIAQVVETTPGAHGGVLDGTLAGLGFGFMFVFISKVSTDSGLLPLATTQFMSVLAVIATATTMRAAWIPRDRSAYKAVVMGPLSITAIGTFMYATHHGLLSVVSVISALYPAATVLLALLVLREKIHLTQAAGLALAAAAVALVAIG